MSIANETNTLGYTRPVLLDGSQIPSSVFPFYQVDISSQVSIAAPPSGKQICLLGGSISLDQADSVSFLDVDGTGDVLWQTPVLTANTPYNFDLGIGRLLALNLAVYAHAENGSGLLTGTLYGYIQ